MGARGRARVEMRGRAVVARPERAIKGTVVHGRREARRHAHARGTLEVPTHPRGRDMRLHAGVHHLGRPRSHEWAWLRVDLPASDGADVSSEEAA